MIKMRISQLTDALEAVVPRSLAEDFDNVGLLVGDPQADVDKVLLAHDVTQAVLDEAIQKGAGLVIAFHPIVFAGLKHLTGQTYVERIVAMALRKGIAIYAMHTNLDNYERGTNHAMAVHLGLKEPKVLLPKRNTIKKLTTYVPLAAAEGLRHALFQAGAGHIGNYSHCSFNFDGEGTYRGEAGSNPTLGTRFSLHVERETCVTVVFPSQLERRVLRALFEMHPYEEVAYGIVTLNNANPYQGMGRIGTMDEAMDERAFLDFLKRKLSLKTLRHSDFTGRRVRRVALLGGSGSFAIGAAKAQGADAFVSGDLKYHNFFEAEGRLLLVDAGHYESEFLAVHTIRGLIKEKFPRFATILSEKHRNPIHYF